MSQRETALILGGARSGKSRLAAARAAQTGLARTLIVTARLDDATRAGDAEMLARIARHRAERAPDWRVIEEPLDLVGALATERGAAAVVVVDCLTLWLSNLYEAGADAEIATSRLAQAVAAAHGALILVSNEVGLGIVPISEAGRRFRDDQGRLNQALAQVCDRVTLVVAGLPLEVKPPA